MLVIVDYHMGNLHSVKKKVDFLKVDSVISSDPAVILSASKLILPGVGHFGQAMENLRKLNLIDALNEAVLVKKTPILGICLGMQLMARESEEGLEQGIKNKEQGLGWFDAEVVKFTFEDTLRFKVPHTGWNTISIAKDSPLMHDIPADAEFYFVHSFYMKANNPSDVLNYTEYGNRFVSAISKGNIYGCQYHPEKSHDVGLQLIRNFVGGFESLSHPIESLSHQPLTEALEVNTHITPLTEALEGNDSALEGNGLRPRIIPVLLLQKLSLVKTQNFKQPKYIGDPINAVKIFNDLKADELVFLDIDASKEKRTISLELVKDIGEEANMPFAVGGGIRSLETIRAIIAAGAEKVVINSYAVENPDFIAEAAATFGSSTIAVCIDVKKKFLSGIKTWSHGGSKASAYSPLEFAQLMEEKGAGEIIIQSIERDGEMNGYDIELIKQISEAVTIPVIALGGAGNVAHLKEGAEKGFANGLAGGSMFVYQGPKRGVLISYPERI
jgi:cyclase